MAINLWEAGGKATSFNPLPGAVAETLSNILSYKDCILTFKAKSPTNAIVRVSAGASIYGDITLSAEMKEYVVSFTTSDKNFIYIYDKNAMNNIVIQDIKLVEKPLGRATINGIDGFLSGKWTLHANAKVIDNETLELNATGDNENSITVNLEPSTDYVISCDMEGNGGFVGGMLLNGSGFQWFSDSVKNIAFKSSPTQTSLRIIFKRTTAGKTIFKRPMLNLGSMTVPYEPKRGERMVIPAFSKNLFNLKELVQTNWTVQALYKDYYLKPNTQYTLSSNVPGTPTANIYFNGSNTNTSGVWNGQPRTVTTDTNGKLYIAIPSNPDREYTQALRDGVYYIQLEEGSTATPFEPYRVQTSRKATKITPINGVPKPARKGLEFDKQSYVKVDHAVNPYFDFEADFIWDKTGVTDAYSTLIDLGNNTANYVAVKTSNNSVFISLNINSVQKVWDTGFAINPGTLYKLRVVRALDGKVQVFNRGIKIAEELTLFIGDLIVIPNSIIGAFSSTNLLPFIGIIERVLLSGVYEIDFTNHSSIVGNTAKAKTGPNGTINGNPRQLNKQAFR